MVDQILHYEFDMTEVSAKMVPKKLTHEQEDNQKNIGSDIIERLLEEPDSLTNVITCDVS